MLAIYVKILAWLGVVVIITIQKDLFLQTEVKEVKVLPYIILEMPCF